MKYRISIITFILFMAAVYAGAQSVYEVASDGRKIQLDGFLLEWKAGASKPFGMNAQWGCDAIKTTEGLSGYCKSLTPLSCGEWKFLFSCGTSNIEADFRRSNDTINNRYCQYDRETFISSGKLVAEWVIPWNRLETDENCIYTLDILVTSSCGDTLPVLSIRGNKQLKKTENVWKGTASRAILIAVLTVVFIVLRRKIRKRTNRRG